MKTLLSLIGLVLTTSLLSAQDLYIYVSDAGNFNAPPWQILRYNTDGSNPSVLIDNNFFISEGLGWPQDIVFLESENAVLISHLIGGRITKHEADTGNYIEDFAVVAGGPTRMEIGQDNIIYVVQWSNSNNKVLRFELDGTALGEYTDIGIAQSIGMDWDSAGNFYVSSYGGGSVSQFDSAGNFLSIYADTELSGPTNLWFDDNDHLYVLDWTAGNVEHYDETGTYVGTWATGLPQAEGVDFLPNGNILIGNGGGASVDQFQPDGTFVETTVPSGSGGLLQPNAVVLREAILGTSTSTIRNVQILPNIGNRFTISSENLDITSVKIYAMSGSLIETLEPNSTLIWDASAISEGLYFISISFDNGDAITHKIVVQK